MSWDSKRPVPWQRLMREWLVYVAIMSVFVLLVIDPSGRVGAFTGLLISGPAYLAFGAVLAKFGYRRERLRRAPRPTPSVSQARRPAPTKRTGGGSPRRRK